MLHQYGNPEVVCMTNTHPTLTAGVLSGKDEYPIDSEGKKTIGNLSKLAWFLNGTDIALELGDRKLTNIVMIGALIAGGQLAL